MKRKISIFCIIIASLFAIVLIALLVLKTLNYINKEVFIGTISSLFATLLIDIAIFVFRKGISDQLVKLSGRRYYYDKTMRNERVRLSYSYLIRIRINNKYLLIKSKRIKSIYQPVGGVYHITNDKYVRTKLGFHRDSSPGDSNDIRGVVIGKNIRRFDRWFDKKKGVEKAPIREFKEELIDTGILNSELFNDDKLIFEYKGTKYEGIKDNIYYSQDAKYELLRYEIYELIPDTEQLSYLRNIKDKSVYLATLSEIRTLGVDKNNNTKRFGTQTNKILED